MKKWIAMTMLALFSVAAFAQNNTKETAPAAKEIKGTVFEKGTLKELLAKAAKEKKYLFVDVYATWCGPCKAMATQVFPQEKVGNYFNKTFVNAKFDAEKGEGIDVAKKYGVRAYPTFLILDKDGTEVGRIVGGADGDMFIEKVKPFPERPSLRAAAFFVFEAERSGRFDRKNRGETHGILKTGRHRIVSHISLFL